MADPRLKVIAEHMLKTLHQSFKGDEYWLGILAALDAAAPTSPPAPDGVEVRIAVAFNGRGMPESAAIRMDNPEPAWEHLENLGYPHRAAIITATVAPPVVPEIAGSVEGV